MTLRSKVIRLAHQKPELRPVLLPLLKTAFEEKDPAFEQWRENAPLSRDPIPPALMLRMRRVLRGAPIDAINLLSTYNRLHSTFLGAPPPNGGFYMAVKDGIRSLLRFLPRLVGHENVHDIGKQIVSSITPAFSPLKRIDRGQTTPRLFYEVSTSLANVFSTIFAAAGNPLTQMNLPGSGRFVGVRLDKSDPEPPAVPDDVASVFTPQEQSLPLTTSQGTNDMDTLYNQALEANELQLDLLNRGTGLDRRIGATVIYPGQKVDLTKPGPVVQIGPIKKKQRLIEKVTSEGADLSAALDLVRATVAVDTISEIPGIIRQLREMGVEFARKPKNRFSSPTSLGYRDLMFNVIYPNGHIGEIQVNLKTMLMAKKSGHLLYEKVREIEARKKISGENTLTPEEQQTVDEANEASKALYEEAWRQAFGSGV